MAIAVGGAIKIGNKGPAFESLASLQRAALQNKPHG
jgi:hypothetical protein